MPKTSASDSLPVVIIGAGLAGLTVALELAESRQVIIMAKRGLSESATAWAQGGIVGVLDQQDSVDAHVDGWIAAQRDDGEPPHVEQVSELQVRLDGEQG